MRGLSCSSLVMLIFVFAAIEPNDCPAATVQNLGPGGLRRGLGAWRQRLSRSPGIRLSGLMLGLNACSSATVSPVFLEISAYVSPGRTNQYGGTCRSLASGRAAGRCPPVVRGGCKITSTTAAVTAASITGARKRPIRPRRGGAGACATIDAAQQTYSWPLRVIVAGQARRY